MNDFAHWSAHDWVRHYAGPRFHPHHARLGTAWDEYGRRLPDAAPVTATGAMVPSHAVGRSATDSSCPASRTPLLLAALAIGVGWHFFGPKPSPEAVAETKRTVEQAKKKVSSVAAAAANVLGHATHHISQASKSLSEKAERFARKRA
jgi:hypothetical protein